MSKSKYKGNTYIHSNRESRRRKRAEIMRKKPRRYRKRWGMSTSKAGQPGPWKKAYDTMLDKRNAQRKASEEE